MGVSGRDPFLQDVVLFSKTGQGKGEETRGVMISIIHLSFFRSPVSHGSSSDGEPGVFDGSVIICFFNVRAQFPNRTRTVPRHMLQYGRNKQQQLRVIYIHERIYSGR